MTVRPILFSGPMVRALLAGRKTQTRRVMKPQPEFLQFYEHDGEVVHDSSHRSWCSHGRAHGRYSDEYSASMAEVSGYTVGDLLYVREAWRVAADLDELSPKDLLPMVSVRYEANSALNAGGLPIANPGRLRPGMHMLRQHSRLTLRVTGVRVEPLAGITSTDSASEGMREWPTGLPGNEQSVWGIDGPDGDLDQDLAGFTPEGAFRRLWNSLNEKRGLGWDQNPWVVAVTFEVILQNVDQITGRDAA